jgi:hypothetical protein
MRQLALASSALVGVNLICLYYVMSINAVFGFAALIIGLIAGFTGGCDDAQPNRALYLKLQIVPLLLLIVQAFHVLFYIRMRGKDWCNEVMNEESEEEDD